MGYDIERFINEINDGLLCCICRDVLEDPLQAPCEHAFCRTCIQGWLVNESSCPEDRKPLRQSDLKPLFRYMRNDLERLRVRCKNFRQGCDHICNLEYVQNHEAECQYESLICPHTGCTVTLTRKELVDHLKNCAFGTKECPNGCGLLMMNPDDKEHNCIAELRTSIEILRSEMICKLDEQRREMEVRLDMQRGHMIQREAAMHAQIEDLKAEISRINQKVKLLMDLELQRRQDLEKMNLERIELLEILRGIQREQEQASRGCCIHCSKGGKVTTL